MFCPKWVFLGGMVLSSVCWADGKAICSTEQASAAEKRVSLISSWNQFHSAYKAFQHCDDGAVGEGFSESASLLMADKWSTLNRLNRLTQRDEKFFAFVLKHIDETVPEERLRQIENNAEKRCAEPTQRLCLAVHRAVGKLERSK